MVVTAELFSDELTKVSSLTCKVEAKLAHVLVKLLCSIQHTLRSQVTNVVHDNFSICKTANELVTTSFRYM